MKRRAYSTLRLKRGIVLLFVLAGAAVAADWPFDRAFAGAADAAKDEERIEQSSGEYVGAAVCAECHGDKHAQFATTPHSILVTDPHTKLQDRGCEACHGPGGAHVEAGGNRAKMFNPRRARPEVVAQTCARCHTEQAIDRRPFHSEHDSRTVACNDCHSPHQAKTNAYLLIDDAPALCVKCHDEVASDFKKPYHHRVFEGGVSCLDCHSAHGRNNTAEARHSDEGLSALCANCHADKHQPFVFEHVAITRSEDGCMACHVAHGSANNRMLDRATVFQLCIQCHSQIGLSVATSGDTMSHDLSDPRIRNCTVCHTQIHGSNSSRAFLN